MSPPKSADPAPSIPGRSSRLRKIHRSLKASIIDGFFNSSMLGSADAAISPFAIAAGASAPQVAQLASLPNLVTALLQSQANSVADWMRSRRRALLTLIAGQGLALLGIACVLFFPPEGRVTAIIAFTIVYMSLGGLISPIWGSLVCEYLPVSRRSSYFGWRNRILGPVVIGAGLVAGWILQGFGRESLYGFFVVFLLGALFRLVSWTQTKRMFEPAHDWAFRERRLRLRLAPEQRRNYFSFLFFYLVMMGSVQISGSLQSLYLLRDLHQSYVTYTLLIAASNATMFFMMGPWGRHADVSGNLKVIRFVACMMPVIPLLWVVSTNPVYLFGVQAFSGVAWAGFNLCTTNFIYDSVPSSERVRATSFFNMANSFAIFIGAILGGQLIEVVAPFRGYSYLTLNLISAVGRALAVWIIMSRVHEVRHVRQVRSIDLFYSIIGLKPLPGVPRETLRTILQNRA